MKLTFLLSTFLVAATFVNAQTPAGNDATTKAIMQLENSLTDAILKSDAAALDKLLASEWFAKSGDTNLVTKTQLMDFVKANGTPWASIKDHDLNIRVHDSAVVVDGYSTRVTKGGDTPMNLRFTRIYAKSPTGWQLVAMHWERVNQ